MEQTHLKHRPVVLVVDDEALLRLHAADTLEEAGYEVIEASDADAAIQVMEARPDIRVLFTDVQMPGRLDGLDLAREVHRRWPEVVLLVTSGRLRLGDDDIPDAGGFVAKPYRTDALLTKVDDLLAARVKQ